MNYFHRFNPKFIMRIFNDIEPIQALSETV
jgi:hypothetical protein